MYTSFEFDSRKKSVLSGCFLSSLMPRSIAGCCVSEATYHGHLAQRVLDCGTRVPLLVQLLQ